MTCVVPGCNNYRSKKASGISFHRFPTTKDKKLSWLNAMELKDGDGIKKSVVCSEHFDSKWINKTLNIIRLKDDAVPTIFPTCVRTNEHIKNTTVKTEETRNQRSQEIRSEYNCGKGLREKVISRDKQFVICEKVDKDFVDKALVENLFDNSNAAISMLEFLMQTARTMTELLESLIRKDPNKTRSEKLKSDILECVSNYRRLIEEDVQKIILDSRKQDLKDNQDLDSTDNSFGKGGRNKKVIKSVSRKLSNKSQKTKREKRLKECFFESNDGVSDFDVVEKSVRCSKEGSRKETIQDSSTDGNYDFFRLDERGSKEQIHNEDSSIVMYEYPEFTLEKQVSKLERVHNDLNEMPYQETCPNMILDQTDKPGSNVKIKEESYDVFCEEFVSSTRQDIKRMPNKMGESESKKNKSLNKSVSRHPCQDCDLSFVRPSYLPWHWQRCKGRRMRCMGGAPVGCDTNGKRVRCHICGNSLSNRNNLKRHMILHMFPEIESKKAEQNLTEPLILKVDTEPFKMRPRNEGFNSLTNSSTRTNANNRRHKNCTDISQKNLNIDSLDNKSSVSGKIESDTRIDKDVYDKIESDTRIDKDVYDKIESDTRIDKDVYDKIESDTRIDKDVYDKIGQESNLNIDVSIVVNTNIQKNCFDYKIKDTNCDLDEVLAKDSNNTIKGLSEEQCTVESNINDDVTVDSDKPNELNCTFDKETFNRVSAGLETFNRVSAGLEKELKYKIASVVYEPKENEKSCKEFSCNVCSETFATEQNLEIHNHLVHEDDGKPFICNHCPRTFGRLFALVAHVKNSHKVQMVDGKNYYLAGSKDLKDKTYPKEINFKVYACNMCSTIYPTLNQLKRHKLNHKTERRKRRCVPSSITQIRKVDKKYPCMECGKVYRSYGGLKEHLLEHSGERPFPCSRCDKSFKSNYILQEHLKTHDSIRPYICDVCGSTYTAISNLERHKRIHTGAMPYKCQVCGRLFRHSDGLKVHIRVHSGEKPWCCGVCQQRFSERRAWQVHMNLHQGIRPYKCDKCEEAFVDRRMLNRHKLKHTDIRNNSIERN